MHVYTSKQYVLRSISTKLNEIGDWNRFDILIFNHKSSKSAFKPESYKALENYLKNVDKVYSFDSVETLLHGAIAYDIVIEQ